MFLPIELLYEISFHLPLKDCTPFLEVLKLDKDVDYFISRCRFYCPNIETDKIRYKLLQTTMNGTLTKYSYLILKHGYVDEGIETYIDKYDKSRLLTMATRNNNKSLILKYIGLYFDDIEDTYSYIARGAGERGNIELIQKMEKLGNCYIDICYGLGKFGNIELIRKYIQYDYENTMLGIIDGNHEQAFFTFADFEKIEDFDYAIPNNGNKKFLDFLINNNHTIRLLSIADYGTLETLKYTISKGIKCEISDSTFFQDYSSISYDVILLMLSLYKKEILESHVKFKYIDLYKLSERKESDYDYIIHHDNLEIIKYYYQAYPNGYRDTRHIGLYGINLIRFLHEERKVILNNDFLNRAIWHSTIEVIKYIIENLEEEFDIITIYKISTKSCYRTEVREYLKYLNSKYLGNKMQEILKILSI